MKKNIVLAITGIVIVLLWWVISIYPDWLWFGRLGYSSVFWTTLLSKTGLGLGLWLLFLIITFLSIAIASRLSKRSGLVPLSGAPNNPLSQAGLGGAAGTLIFVGLVLFSGLS